MQPTINPNRKCKESIFKKPNIATEKIIGIEDRATPTPKNLVILLIPNSRQSEVLGTQDLIKEEYLQNMEQSLKNLRIADVELFLSAARMKNLGKSAKFHYLSQSAASTAIQRVEIAFGVQLCTHEKRHFGLTQDGEFLLSHLDKWIKDLKNLIITKEQTPIRLATTHAIAQIAVPSFFDVDNMEFMHMRPDKAYAAVLHGEIDMTLVLDNSPWKGVITAEVGSGSFQLYALDKNSPIKPILLPEDQISSCPFSKLASCA